MTRSAKYNRRIVTKPSYSLEIRRKAWEIIQRELKEIGVGHAAYLNIIENTLRSAVKNGASILSFSETPLNIEELTKDDLFGFLGRIVNPPDGPARKISDTKFAVLDAYFTLIDHPMWMRFTVSEQAFSTSLSSFWKPQSHLPEEFFKVKSNSFWVTQSIDLRNSILREEDRRKLKHLPITAIQLTPTSSRQFFKILVAKFPLVSSFIEESDEAFDLVRGWTVDLEGNRLGTLLFEGYGCLLEHRKGDYEIVSVIRDSLTHQPIAKEIKISAGVVFSGDSSFQPKPDFSSLKTEVNGKTFQEIVFEPETEYFDKGKGTMLNSFFFQRVKQVFFPPDREFL